MVKFFYSFFIFPVAECALASHREGVEDMEVVDLTSGGELAEGPQAMEQEMIAVSSAQSEDSSVLRQADGAGGTDQHLQESARTSSGVSTAIEQGNVLNSLQIALLAGPSATVADILKQFPDVGGWAKLFVHLAIIEDMHTDGDQTVAGIRGQLTGASLFFLDAQLDRMGFTNTQSKWKIVEPDIIKDIEKLWGDEELFMRLRQVAGRFDKYNAECLKEYAAFPKTTTLINAIIKLKKEMGLQPHAARGTGLQFAVPDGASYTSVPEARIEHWVQRFMASTWHDPLSPYKRVEYDAMYDDFRKSFDCEYETDGQTIQIAFRQLMQITHRLTLDALRVPIISVGIEGDNYWKKHPKGTRVGEAFQRLRAGIKSQRLSAAARRVVKSGGRTVGSYISSSYQIQFARKLLQEHRIHDRNAKIEIDLPILKEIYTHVHTNPAPYQVMFRWFAGQRSLSALCIIVGKATFEYAWQKSQMY